MCKTMAIFRAYPDKSVIALMPCQEADILGRYCVSYVHIGQHGSALYWWVVSQTRPATPEEAMPLADEMKGLVGYNLAVRQRAPSARYRDKWIAEGNN
jgi:hypothetical protein